MAELAQLGPFLYTPDGQRAPRKRKKSGPRATKIFRLPFCINHAIVATGGAMLGGVVPVACEPDGNPVCVVRGYRRSHGPINRCMRLHVYTFIHLHVYTFIHLYIYTLHVIRLCVYANCCHAGRRRLCPGGRPRDRQDVPSAVMFHVTVGRT